MTSRDLETQNRQLMPVSSPCHFLRRPGIVSSEFLMLVGINLRFIKFKEALLLDYSCVTPITFF